MSREQQTFWFRVVLVVVLACLAVAGRRRVLAASLSLSNSINLRIKPDPDRNVTLEWNSETCTTYAIYWRDDFTDRWHLLGGEMALRQRV